MEDIRFAEEFMLMSEDHAPDVSARILYRSSFTGDIRERHSRLENVKLVEQGNYGEHLSPQLRFTASTGTELIAIKEILEIQMADKTLIRHNWGLEMLTRNPIYDEDENTFTGESEVRRCFSGWATSAGF